MSSPLKSISPVCSPPRTARPKGCIVSAITPDPQPLRRQATRGSPLIPAMDIRARCPILRTPVPVMGLPWLGIPAIDLLRTGDLGPSTRSSLLAEFWPDTKSSRRCAGGWSDRRVNSAVHCSRMWRPPRSLQLLTTLEIKSDTQRALLESEKP
jgi:hypothetical protein